MHTVHMLCIFECTDAALVSMPETHTLITKHRAGQNHNHTSDIDDDYDEDPTAEHKLRLALPGVCIGNKLSGRLLQMSSCWRKSPTEFGCLTS